MEWVSHVEPPAILQPSGPPSTRTVDIMTSELADRDFVERLLDTDFDPHVGDEVSTIAAAIREARNLTGRDDKTGIEADPNRHRATWAGALVWFIVLEQLATCFKPADDPKPDDDHDDLIACALQWFADVRFDTAIKLDKLRNRFAHDYSLETPDGSKRYRLGVTGPLLKDDNRRPRVSLYELANKAEQALSRVRELADDDNLVLRLPIETIQRRFTMTLEEDDVGPGPAEP